MSHPLSADRFLQAFRAGANAQQMDVLLAEVRRDYRIRRDMEKLTELSLEPNDCADEVAGLLQRARYLLETA